MDTRKPRPQGWQRHGATLEDIERKERTKDLDRECPICETVARPARGNEADGAYYLCDCGWTGY